ncbi:MAG: hypothetical protein E6G09_05195 [Actinobacteria bacterium]|nr:MAG: hypothetical protein E6G09_05195 [Actinomycetota bacterium]
MLAGCGGTSNHSAAGGADLVPASAALFVAVDSDPSSSQWQTIDALASKFPDKQKAVDSIKQQLRKKGLDWERDLKPALGSELDVVMLDFAHPNETVALMQPQDEGAFKQLVKKGNAADPSSQLVSEKFHGWTVMSDKQASIDAFKQASGSATRMLSDDKTFSSAIGKSGDGIVRAYVNGAKVMAAARNFLGPDAGPYFKKLGTLDWLLMTLRAKSDGIAWDTTVHGTPGKEFKNVSEHASDGSLQKLVPKDALLYLAFHGSKGMLGGLGNNPILQQSGFKGLGDALQQLGRIMAGENALYVRAPGSSDLPEVTFLAAPEGGLDGAVALDSVLNRFAKELGGRPHRSVVAGVPVRAIGTGAGVVVRYANVNGKLVVTDLPSGIAFAKNGGKVLADSQEYQDASRSSGLPAKPQVVLYVDIHSTIPLIRRFGNAGIPASVERNLKPLRSAVEYAVNHSHEIQISFFLRIQ